MRMVLRLPRPKTPRLIAPAVVPVYGIVLGAALFVGLTVALGDFTYDARALNGAVCSLIAMALAGALLNYYGSRIGSGMEAIALFSAISLAAPICGAILASTDLPMADPLLADLDRRLFFGFDRSKLALAFMQKPMLMEATRLVYHSLFVQPSLLLALLYGTGRQGRGSTLLLAWGMSLGIILAIFPFFPATGSPPYFLDFVPVLHAIRDGSLRVIGLRVLTGIVCFPSFHACAAMLLAWGFAPIRRIGPCMIALNMLMFFSALVASHYLIDLFAGGLVACLSIWLSHRIQARIENANSRPAPAYALAGVEGGPAI